jgi:exopolysaccharide production protein ExoZ
LFKADPELFAMGRAGVDLFFVISGFIMVVSSQKLFGQDGAARAFLCRRVTRIVPLYWLATLTLIGLELMRHNISLDPPTLDVWERTIAGFFFFPIDSPAHEPILTVGWSLNHEMLFYLLFAATIRFRQWVALASVCGLLVALVVLGRTGIVHHIGIQAVWLNGIQLEFIYGIAIGVLYLRCRPGPAIGALSLAFGVAILMRSNYSTANREFYLGLPAALIVLGAVCLPQVPARSQAGRLVTLLGDASYALYLLHWILFAYSGHDLPRFILLALAVALSIAVRLLIEVPMLNVFRRLTFTSRRPQAIGTTR